MSSSSSLDLSVAADTIRKVAVSVGYSKLKPEQEKAILSFVFGNDVFVSLPTGYGKSLCFGHASWGCCQSVYGSPFFKLQPQARQQSISTMSTCTRAAGLLDIGASAGRLSRPTQKYALRTFTRNDNDYIPLAQLRYCDVSRPYIFNYRGVACETTTLS